MATLRALSEQFVLGHALPSLVEAGYEQDDDSLIWRKEAGEITRLLWVMFSQRNSRSECRFTINLDVCSDRARAAVGSQPVVKRMPAAGFPGHVNVSRALSGPPQGVPSVPQVWWETAPGAGFAEADVSSFEQAVAAGIDWLEAFDSLQDCYEFLLAIESWLSHIPIGLELGDPEASITLRGKLAEPHSKGRRSYLMGLAERYGVEVPVSYDIVIFDVSSKAAHESGLGLDEIDHQPIDEQVRVRFVERLDGYGFERKSGDGSVGRFVESEFGIEVAVRECEISFQAPFGDAVFEALMTASELSDVDELALFDPQVGAWND